MTNSTEDLIKQLKRSRRSSQILVPLIEEFMKRPVEIEDDVDREYLRELVSLRSEPRKQGVYSPSMLGDCLRKVFFAKTSAVRKKPIERIESSGYFLDGNFRHFKWQFVVFKMHRAGIIQLIDVGTKVIGTEIHVSNKKGDSSGTLDNLIWVPDEEAVFNIDWKGMGGNNFNKYLFSGPPMNYIIQSVNYAGIANHSLKKYLPAKIEKILIIGENKNGPINSRKLKSPLGLYEWAIDVPKNRHLVAERIKALRAYERRGEIPPPECKSTASYMFKNCMFNDYCRGEVEAIEKKRLRTKKITNQKVEFNRGRKKG